MQKKFDDKLLACGLFDFSGYGPVQEDFYAILATANYAVRGFRLVKRNTVSSRSPL